VLGAVAVAKTQVRNRGGTAHFNPQAFNVSETPTVTEDMTVLPKE
jgi:hypothetical protein